MKKPAAHPLENLRLQELLKYRILDTLPESTYDDVTRLASQICGTPVAMISLIDRNRQWFKAKHGSDLQQTPRDLAFCAHAILSQELTEVPDLSLDDRFRDNPLVANAPHARFYAGAPLVTPSGVAIGTLCVLDLKPRRLTDEQKSALVALSRQVVTQLELRKANFELLNSHRQLMEAHRLAALGQMAAGIAHEINNPLTIILSRAEQVQMDLEKGVIEAPALKEKMTSIEHTTQRIARIVHGLRVFARDDTSAPMRTNSWAQIRKETLSFCRERLHDAGIELICDESTDFDFLCHPLQIQQVLLNLLGNAADAVAGLNERWIRLEAATTADGIEIRVTDSGRGLGPHVRHRIFEPFFTTKEVGKGMGLGLSISKGVIEDHGGSLRYDEESPHTRFILRLPRDLTTGAPKNAAG